MYRFLERPTLTIRSLISLFVSLSISLTDYCYGSAEYDIYQSARIQAEAASRLSESSDFSVRYSFNFDACLLRRSIPELGEDRLYSTWRTLRRESTVTYTYRVGDVPLPAGLPLFGAALGLLAASSAAGPDPRSARGGAASTAAVTTLPEPNTPARA